MIQTSYAFTLHGPGPAASAPLRLRAQAADDGTTSMRLTGAWPHDDLVAARRQVAAFMASLAPDTVVRCNLTGREKPAHLWTTELRAPPTVASVFSARHAIVEDRLIARLFGAYAIGESDIVLLADARDDVAEVYRFLNAWAGFRLGAATAPGPTEPPVWDRPFPWGYWLVSFAESDVGDADFWVLVRDGLGTHHLRDAFDERMHAPAPRVVIEAADPGDPDTTYLIGASAALGTSARQRLTAERLGAEVARSPSAQDAAGFCERVFATLGHAYFAYREPAQGPNDSGWRIGCVEPEHRHDGDSLRIAPLAQAAVVPELVDYLALPEGWVVTYEDGAFWTNAPGQAESHRDARADDADG